MNTAAIHPGTTMGAVHLTVTDLERCLSFYRDRLGFETNGRDAGTVRLGAGGADLLVLREDRRAPLVRGTTGLYHFAILVPSRRHLAESLAHLIATRTPLTGAADHGVSEAVYLPDPEGNGIEIYRDRARDEWPSHRGRLTMTTDPLDVDGLLAERDGAGPARPGLAPGTRIGHVHLHVGDLAAADRFYAGALGFERTQRMGGSALFLSAGGYHHHIGLNTWAGVGAPPPPDGAAGLDHFVVIVPDRVECDRIAARVGDMGFAAERQGSDVSLRDPSSHRVLITAAATQGTGS